MRINSLKDFQPTLFQTFKNYNKEKFLADLMSGLIVGVVALPLAIAFGIASGVTPEKGIFTAIIAGFIISFLGGSTVQIGGPTGAFIVIVYGIVEQYGVQGLAIATVLAGVMLVVMGFLKLGSIIKFVPYPIVVGFTSGIALTIFSTQIKDFFGLTTPKLPSGFIEKWGIYFQNFSSVNWWVTIIAVVSVLIIILTPRVSRRVPGSLIAIILMSVVVYFLRNYANIEGIETIGDRFNIQSELPQIKEIAINLESIRLLFPSAFTIAMLCAIESLLSATVADGVTGKKHNSNMELIAQGAANIITPFFGGIPATGAIARTMTNINNGGRTPVAGIIHSIVLLLIVLFLGDLTKHIPMACLAGILVVVAYNMSEWRTFVSLMKQSRSTQAILLTTFLLTVIIDLTVAISVGLLLAIFAFLKRMNEYTEISHSTGELKIESDSEVRHEGAEEEKLLLPDSVEVYEIRGPFFFGVANKFDEKMRNIGEHHKIRIIRMRKVPFIDSTGLNNLEALIKNSIKEKIHVILSGVRESVREQINKTNIPELIGEEYICSDIQLAVEKAVELDAVLKEQKPKKVH
ncbi:MAG TPA: STAS domain-containing protein [Fermentimonas caenicola]|jgi:SulP family sulfate permease|uniref:SulP family inorganic anion transporter n=1 Tax=Lascolabacillus sp. TaxID=1924068 RepID=UPI00121E462E|nr:SulP family inorganic anion transporter [Lascolabacillus sp.]MBP6176363.1 STAS domain-containing protein [Fermentimonas sp.]TAH62255.1 MAG: STAS domain-containing protein [Fermentimonas caenicola]MBP7105152.1 STAS domain-containing protein [Fermentimonas sp.]MDD4758441.1 SulP family inorganic anion transporter [Lascolabacillus sp.]HHU42393.1 STAS domain-containing protein [Fermentimonas caenicola]